MAEQTRSGRIKRMPEWYSFKKSEKDLIEDLCGEQDDLYGFGRFGLSGDETEMVMAYGGEFFFDDVSCQDDELEEIRAMADPDGLYIETMRRAYREEFWDYLIENGEDW